MNCKTCKNYKPNIRYMTFNQWVIWDTKRVMKGRGIGWIVILILMCVPFLNWIVALTVIVEYYLRRYEK